MEWRESVCDNIAFDSGTLKDTVSVENSGILTGALKVRPPFVIYIPISQMESSFHMGVPTQNIQDSLSYLLEI